MDDNTATAPVDEIDATKGTEPLCRICYGPEDDENYGQFLVCPGPHAEGECASQVSSTVCNCAGGRSVVHALW